MYNTELIVNVVLDCQLLPYEEKIQKCFVIMIIILQLNYRLIYKRSEDTFY